jgi:raffinose/stachyose/melibiose transport system substrate-binding protein
MTKKRIAMAVALAGVLVLSACSGTGNEATSKNTKFPSGKVSLTLWWWGQQEAPGADKYIEKAIAAYEKKRPNVTITPVLQTTDGLVPSFQAAASSKSGPDLQYFWGGTNALTPAWNDQILPISDYLPQAEIAHYLNKTEETYQGKVWTAPWYVQPSFPLLVRKDVLAKYNATVPSTWDELMKTCDTLSAQGVTTLAGGVKDGWFGGWLYSMLGAQDISSPKDVIAAAVGTKSFTDTKQAEWWKRLAESKKHKCWNDDINSLELYQAQARFVSGEAAMTITAGTDAPNFVEKAGGDENVVVMAMPSWSKGPYAGKLGSTSQTLGLTKWTKYPQVGADFIRFLHEPTQLNSWYAETGSLPADDRFDTSQVTSTSKKALFDMAIDGAPYLENYIPPQLDSDAVFKNVQLVLQGSKTPAAAAADMEATAKRLRTTDRTLVKNFTAWSK